MSKLSTTQQAPDIGCEVEISSRKRKRSAFANGSSQKCHRTCTNAVEKSVADRQTQPQSGQRDVTKQSMSRKAQRQSGLTKQAASKRKAQCQSGATK